MRRQADDQEKIEAAKSLITEIHVTANKMVHSWFVLVGTAFC